MIFILYVMFCMDGDRFSHPNAQEKIPRNANLRVLFWEATTTDR